MPKGQGRIKEEARLIRRDKVWRLWLAGHKDPRTIARLVNADWRVIVKDLEYLKKTEVAKFNEEDSELAYTEAVRRAESVLTRMTDLVNTAHNQALRRIKDDNGKEMVVLDRDMIFPMMELQRNLMASIKYLNELRGVEPAKKLEINTTSTNQIAITGFGDPLPIDRAQTILAELTPTGGWEKAPPEVVYPDENAKHKRIEDKSGESKEDEPDEDDE